MAGASGQGGWGTGFEGCFPPILPPLRHVPRRRSGSARQSGARPKRVDPPGKILKSSHILGGAQQPQSAAPPMGLGAAQRVGSTRRRANQLNGSTVATPSSRGVSPTRRRAVVRDRASFPTETVHGRSPRFGRRMGACFVGAGAAAASRHAACDDLVPASNEVPRCLAWATGPSWLRPAPSGGPDGVTRPCADPVRFAAAPRRVARRAAGSASPWRRRDSPTPVRRRLLAS